MTRSRMPREAVNDLELRVVGLSRSGNHAIIDWIRRQSTGDMCFLNCAEPRTNPFVTARPMGDGRRVAASCDGFDLDREASGDHSGKDLFIHSYEDCFLTTVCHADFEDRHDEFVGSSERRIDVLILRDPFNLFASRTRSGFGSITPLTTVRIWRQHARQFLGERNYVTQEFLPISFNRWTEDRSYRRELVDHLGLEFSDEGTNMVPRTGGGSSFDGRKHHGNAERMDVFGRWRHFREDLDYLSLFTDEILELSDAIFGRVDESDAFGAFRRRLAS